MYATTTINHHLIALQDGLTQVALGDHNSVTVALRTEHPSGDHLYLSLTAEEARWLHRELTKVLAAADPGRPVAYSAQGTPVYDGEDPRLVDLDDVQANADCAPS